MPQFTYLPRCNNACSELLSSAAHCPSEELSMIQLPRQKPLHQSHQVASHSALASRQFVIMAKQVLGDYLDELLVGTNQPNTCVWVPKTDCLRNPNNNLTLRLYLNQKYSAAELQIANAIRLYLTNHHMIKGKDIQL